MAGAKGVWNIAAMAEQYGPLFKLQLLTSVVVVLSDPQTISRVARKTGGLGPQVSLQQYHPACVSTTSLYLPFPFCRYQLPYAIVSFLVSESVLL
jgi:hypothetical protein